MNNYKISIDFIMIIGKYFKNSKDFINLIKVNKKYKDLLLLYHFNPINNPNLFPNIQTQYFYNKNDLKYKIKGLYKYIHLYEINYKEIKNKKENEIYKNIILTDYINEIPNGITKIKNHLYFKSNLKTINLPNSLKELSNGLFIYSKIEKINIPNSITSIGNECFLGNKLKEINLSNSLIKLGESCFEFQLINKIKIPNSINKIPKYCFMYCNNLEYIELSNNLIEIDDYAFCNTNIKNLDLNKYEKLIKLNYGCFMNCYKLETFKFPPNLLYLGDYSFNNCNLININLPYSLLKFNKNCFKNCLNINIFNYNPKCKIIN